MVKRTPSELAALVKQTKAKKPVTPIQFRLALFDTGLLDKAQDFFNSGDARRRIEWEGAPAFTRLDGWVTDLQSKLDYTDDEMDDLFLLAQTL